MRHGTPTYPYHDLQSLEPHYCRHVSAMTSEGLHAKSDIAAQLAWRDAEIERLRAALAQPPEPQAEQPSPVWLLEKVMLGIGPSYVGRRKWEQRQEISWVLGRENALSFPTQAEAIMFAREYLPELEGEVVARERKVNGP